MRMMDIKEILRKYQGTTATVRNGVHLQHYDAATNIVHDMCSEYAGGEHGDYIILLSDHWMILQTVFDDASETEKSWIFHLLVSKFDKVLKVAIELMNRKFGARRWSIQEIE